MKKSLLKISLFFFLTCLLLAVGANAQKRPDCLKTASLKRPTHVLVSLSKLKNFYRNFEDNGTVFKEAKIVKSELSYYLMAAAENSSMVYVFELEQKGKKLFLNKKMTVQSCSEGEFSLDTFLQQDGKIKGCRMGAHRILSQ